MAIFTKVTVSVEFKVLYKGLCLLSLWIIYMRIYFVSITMKAIAQYFLWYLSCCFFSFFQNVAQRNLNLLPFFTHILSYALPYFVLKQAPEERIKKNRLVMTKG